VQKVVGGPVMQGQGQSQGQGGISA
jgi:hypothetical protein